MSDADGIFKKIVWLLVGFLIFYYVLIPCFQFFVILFVGGSMNAESQAELIPIQNCGVVAFDRNNQATMALIRCSNGHAYQIDNPDEVIGAREVRIFKSQGRYYAKRNTV